MNKIVFSFILVITVTFNMLAFPVYAAEAPISDTQMVSESPYQEDSPDDSGEETVIAKDGEKASEKETIAESVPAEGTVQEAGTGDTIGEEPTTEGDTEETADGDKNEIEEVQSEDPASGKTEISSDDPEDSASGMTEMLPDDMEDSDDLDDLENLEDLEDSQTTEDDAVVDEELENDDTSAPAMVYDRPVINKISTDGKSITLEWDNEEGALFRIYRGSILPYQIGTSTTGSFVDTNVIYGWSYSYFIATDSSSYRYPYSQTVSKWVRYPIVDIDEEHRIGEDLAWDLGDKDQGRGSLVISGSGSMPDFATSSDRPWNDSRSEIKSISIDDGVTYIGDHSFSDMEGLEEVSLPSSVREYGHEVFRGSTNLEYFNHDNAVDGGHLCIAVQYLTGVYSGDAFEPDVYVRKGADGDDFDGMPALVQGRDYTVTYNNMTEVGDGTIVVTFIGDYADADSVVIPFTVVSALREGEKIKSLTGIELEPSSSTYTGSAQHPDMTVRSGRWILKEGVDYILSYEDMVDEGTYTITAEGIGAYSGKVQENYTILEQKKPPVDPKPSVNPPVPVKPSTPSKPHVTDPVDPASDGKVRDRTPSNESTESQDRGSQAYVEPDQEETAEAYVEPDQEETTETAEKTEKNPESTPSVVESRSNSGGFGKGGFGQGESRDNKDDGSGRFFVGAVGIVASICVGVYFWFFHWFLHGM